MKRIYCAVTLIVSLLFTANVYGQSVPFLNINPDARMAGMANAGVSMDATAFAMYNNTAATALSDQKMDVGVSYGLWQPGSAGNNMIAVAGYGRIAKFMTISAGLKYFGYDSYNITDGGGMITGDFAPKEMSAGIGLGFRILPILSLSANVSYVMSNLAPEGKANAVSADFGAMLDLKFIRVGATVSNIGSKVKYLETAYSLPANAKLGVSTTQYFGNDDKNAISASVQAGLLFDDASMFAEVGAEYAYNDLFRVSLGYHYGAEKQGVIPSYLSAGAGVKLFGAYLNFAYLTGFASDSPMNNTIQIGVGYTF